MGHYLNDDAAATIGIILAQSDGLDNSPASALRFVNARDFDYNVLRIGA
jgi:hypothetical protein